MKIKVERAQHIRWSHIISLTQLLSLEIQLSDNSDVCKLQSFVTLQLQHLMISDSDVLLTLHLAIQELRTLHISDVLITSEL
jgi:hypothetical protein